VKASENFRIDSVTTEEGLSRLEAPWNALAKHAETPNAFATFDWFRAWNSRAHHEGLHKQRQLNVLAIREAGVIAGISPLVLRTVSRFGLVVRKIEFVESPADYNELVLGTDLASQIEAVVRFLEQTQHEWDVVDLRCLRDVGNTMAHIERALSCTNLLYRMEVEARCPYLSIDSDFWGVAESRSPSTRQTLRNEQRRLDRMRADGLRIRIIEAPQDEPELVAKLVALESQKRVDGEYVAPVFARCPTVLQLLFDTLGRDGWIYVALMELGSRPLAFQLGFRCGRALWDFTKAYDHSFSKLSPGTMLFSALIDYGFSHGYQEYDFLRGEEPYKMKWSVGSHETFRLTIRSRHWLSRVRGFLYLDFKAALYSAIEGDWKDRVLRIWRAFSKQSR
jgi:CelD/BcsL family acetyltransferase involved in cellulose biosynthesis